MKQKYLSLIFLTSIIYINAFAQPTVKTQRTAGGNDQDEFQSMWLTKDGGLIAGGFSYSKISGEKTDTTRGGSDYWVVKLDSTGRIQWNKTIGGDSEDRLTCLQETSDGGYILGGSSYSNISGEKTQKRRGKAGVWDFWVVKLDSKGNIQWDKTIGGTDADWLNSLQQTTDGGYIVGGYSFSNISGEKTENSRGGQDFWIVKLDGNGHVQWDKTIGGNGSDALYSLQQTNDAGYILGGTSFSSISGEKTENDRGYIDYWVIKLDSLANIQWDKTIGGNDLDILISLQQTRDTGYILGGYSLSNASSEKTENSRGVTDYWIIKLNKAGNIQWDKTIGSSGYDYLHAIQQTSDCGYILGGYSYSNISGEKTENSKGGDDYWVVKLKSNGNIQWDKTVGGNSQDDLMCIKELAKNRYVLGGFSSSGISGDKTDTTRGGYDYWLVALVDKAGTTAVTSVLQNNTATEIINKNNHLIAYPNPAKNSVTVNFITQKNSQYILEIADLNGKILLRKKVNAIQGINRTTLDVSRFAKGVYWINIISSNAEKSICKFEKQ